MVQSYGLGTNAYVVKPIEFDDFSEAVRLLRPLLFAHVTALPL